jgi:peptidoglycan/xylan/chitin deacetylase (PgdA/CDA1 family)/SAM-dependent methyltransferase
VTPRAALRRAYDAGRSAADAARDDPGSDAAAAARTWFDARWARRAVRRVATGPPGTLRARLVALAAPGLAEDIAFWAGVRRACSRREWARLTRESYVALCYHRVANEPGPGQERITVPPAVFRRQMRILRWARYRPLSSADVVAFHADGATIGRRRYALTADDGFRDFLHAALDAGVRPQFFVPTAAVGQCAWWTDGGEVAGWDELAAAANAGVEIGSHGRRHVPLAGLDAATVREELTGSRDDLARHVGAPRLVAYPNGRYDDDVLAAAAAAGYDAAYSTDAGRNGQVTDRFRLHRVTPKAWDSTASFLYRVVTGDPVPHRWDRRRQRLWERRSRRRCPRAAIEARVYPFLRTTSPGRRYRTKLVAAEVGRQVAAPTARVLDAGSEDGILATEIGRRNPGWSIVAIDINADSLHDGSRWAADHGARNVGFVAVDMTRLLRDEAFDAVVAVDCLTEVPDDDAALGAIARALRPGGTLVAHTPIAGWQPVLRGSGRHWPRAVRRGYEPGELERKLRDVGLTVVAMHPTLRGTGHLAQEVRDRWVKRRRLLIRLAAAPFLIGAVRLEMLGATWGKPRGLLVVARRPG